MDEYNVKNIKGILQIKPKTFFTPTIWSRKKVNFKLYTNCSMIRFHIKMRYIYELYNVTDKNYLI